jgi:hypothetical protein
MGAALEAVSWLQPSRIGSGSGGLSLRFPPFKCAAIRATKASEQLGVRALLAGGSAVEFGRDRFEREEIGPVDDFAGETALLSMMLVASAFAVLPHFVARAGSPL